LAIKEYIHGVVQASISAVKRQHELTARFRGEQATRISGVVLRELLLEGNASDPRGWSW